MNRSGDGPGGPSEGGVIGRFLVAMVAHDWETMAACVQEDVVRTGPFGDTYTGREDYRAFIADLLPSLPGYRMDVARVWYSADGMRGVAELSETVEVDGRAVLTPEALVFDVGEAGLIARIGIYTQRRDPGGGGSARG